MQRPCRLTAVQIGHSDRSSAAFAAPGCNIDGGQAVKRLVLLGGGHAHLFVLEGLIKRPLAGVDTTLISLSERQAYSGMVPGLIGGRYCPSELSFDLSAISLRGGVTFLRAEAAELIPGEHRVRLSGGRTLDYDVLSVATGSTIEGWDSPGVDEHAYRVKPIGRAVEIVPALEQAAAGSEAPAVVVVGGGAAGIEVALGARARLRRLGCAAASVTLLESGPRLLGGGMPRGEGLIARALVANQVTVRLGCRVSAVLPDAVLPESGEALPANLTIWSTGATAPPLLRQSGLPLDPRGFLLVDHQLRSLGDPSVFAAGDAATLAHRSATAKAGVYAVREGPVLWKNLVASLSGLPLEAYHPQQSFLAILNTGDGKAMLSYRSRATWSTWAMVLKDRIDRSFMRRFQRLEPPRV
jgi:selenide,water dikinase